MKKRNKYTVGYFIKKFSRIPNRLWTTGRFLDASGRCCALGHCGHRVGGFGTLESYALINLTKGRFGVVNVNDEPSDRFKQKTPRGRILAALRSLRHKPKAAK